MFEERMASLEGAESGPATATGMAAVTAAMMGQVKAGDHVVAARALSVPAAGWSRTCCRASASAAPWSTDPISTNGAPP